MFESDPKGASGGLNRILEAALDYRRRGWSVVQLNGKRPATDGWQNTQYDEAELPRIFGDGNCNLGVVLGRLSGGLADLDLDCVEALSLVATFLPPTSAIFGRASKPGSHRLYNVGVSADFRTVKLVDPEQLGKSETQQGCLLELRGGGGQTMMPPSIHPTGEAIEWGGDVVEPAAIEYGALLARVAKLAAGALILRRWNKGLPRHDTTLALTGALLQGGLTADDVTQFVLTVADDDEPDDRRRAVEDTIKKVNAGEPVAGAAKCIEIFGDKTWSKISEWLGLRNAGEWGQFDPSIINDCKNPAPEFPLEVFGENWACWLGERALETSAPVDYVAGSLLVAAGSLIGNARRGAAWDGFEQPPIFWVARIGHPSSGKSPAADPVHKAVHELEQEKVEQHHEALREWEQNCERAKAARAAWNAAVKESHKAGGPAAGDLPVSACEPERPRYPHLAMTDATIEVLGFNQAGLPRGFALLCDELGGWFGSFGRYSKGGPTSDTAFWLSAYDGRFHKIDRVHHKEKPYTISHLSIGIDGAIQPDTLASLLLSRDDDGLAARFLPIWPEPVALERPAPRQPGPDPAIDALRKLRDLGSYRVLRLTDEAAERFQAWRITNAAAGEHSSGMLRGWLGKLPGVVLRLALTISYLIWCSELDAVPEPESIGLDATLAAVRLVDSYFLPMARRAFGDAASPEPERDAAAIARLIVAREIGEKRGERYIVNLRKDVQKKGINRIRVANQARAALDELREAGWVRPAAVATGGRPRGDYEVNPKALEVQSASLRRGNRPPSTTWRAKKTKY